jgi:alginate O-acetyltransferase complex protein AlgI
MFIRGFIRFGIGLFKKVWIADVLAKYADIAFGVSGTIPFDYAWIGIIAYTFQIYFDFSAYSDMAIGLLLMMGFRINENFNQPYISKSITEFWKRWHISMTSWFREYLYFPLGGNRKGKIRTYVNQWIVFLISGFWHGAAWNFVFWGIYHGTFLCVERAFLNKVMQKINHVARWLITMLLIMLGWVFFRADSINKGFAYIRDMFNFGSYYTHVSPTDIMIIDPRGWFIMGLACVISFAPVVFAKTYNTILSTINIRPRFVATIVLFLFSLSTLKVIAASSISPFIYFRF